MSTQVIRVERFTKGSLQNVGNEAERAEGIEHRNSDIDHDLTKFNNAIKSSNGGFYKRFNQILEELNCTFKGSKNQTAFEGMIITSDSAFFEEMGYIKGRPPPPAVTAFFDNAYKWALSQIGFRGTDNNIISAVVHYDERTPHLHINYIPIVDRWKEKVYQTTDDGKIARNEHGSPIQAKDEKGKCIFKIMEHPEAPKVSRGDFWAERGGKNSYSKLQDSFFENIGIVYGLGRGEIGSDKRHQTKYEWKKKELEKELETVENEIKTAQAAQEQLHSEVIQNEIKNNELRKKNKELEKNNAELKKEIEQKKNEVARLDDEITANRLQLVKEQRPPRPEIPDPPQRPEPFSGSNTDRKAVTAYNKSVKAYDTAYAHYEKFDIPRWEKECRAWDKKYLTADNLERTVIEIEDKSEALNQQQIEIDELRDDLDDKWQEFEKTTQQEIANIQLLRDNANRYAVKEHIKANGLANSVQKLTSYDELRKAAAPTDYTARMRNLRTPQELMALDKAYQQAQAIKELKDKKKKTKTKSKNYYELER